MHLHDLKTLLDTPEIKIDYCIECKKRFYYRKDKIGRIDNGRYLEDHKRNYIQRDNPMFKELHGKPFDLEEDKKILEKENKKYEEYLERKKYEQNR